MKKIQKRSLLGKFKDWKKRWCDIFNGETLGFFIGLLVLSFSIFLFLSLSSYLTNGTADQAYILRDVSDVHYKNICGKGGAITAHYLFNSYFGVSSFFIPLFLLGWSAKLMHTYRIRLWRWFLNCGFLMIWFSITLTMLSSSCFLGLFPHSWMQIPIEEGWGGAHGQYICSLLDEYIGIAGLFLCCAVSAIVYIVILWKDTINWFKALLRPTDFIPEKKPHLFAWFRRKKKSAEKDDTVAEEFEKDVEDTKEAEVIEDTHAEESEKEAEVIEDTHAEESEKEDIVVVMPDEVGVADDLEGEEVVVEEDPQPTSIDFDVTDDVEEQSSYEVVASKDLELEIKEGHTESPAGKNIVASSVAYQGPYDPRKDLEYYNFPTLSLLKHYDDIQPQIDMEEQHDNKQRILKVLEEFGAKLVGLNATIGPTVTLYEGTPAPGVRINRIRNLEDDIALSLSAIGIRIIAPIPGRGTIGIEVPNKNPKLVSMESILNSKKFRECDYELPVAIGKTITNEVFMFDLAKMPHLLVAGATGQGKSVGLNAMIASLLYKKHPSELKLVMVDPKKVEFSIYAPLENYFLAKIPSNDDAIITDVDKVVQTLKSLCEVMDHRYDLLKKAHVRHIKEYNKKFIERKLNPEDGHEYMPYIVIIIDEYGDLMMTAGKEVELPIARIAQLARAVGMHMVIATQRPTTNIITGTIKANFPARMAFKVMSTIDSRTILERKGANQLVGRGDMLFLCGNEPVRVQCAFIDTQEVDNINQFISKQQGYVSAFELPEVGEDSFGEEMNDDMALDSIFGEVAKFVVIRQTCSISLIQRHFCIGFNRSGRIVDQLEHYGIISAPSGSKPREVLVTDESYVDKILKNKYK